MAAKQTGRERILKGVRSGHRAEHTALIDGDVVAYRACHLNDSNMGDLKDLEELLHGIVSAWADEAGCDEAVVCLSGRSFRYDIEPSYKHNRVGKEKPKDLPAALKILESMAHVRVKNLEADDVIGILATNGKFKDPVIVSIDKDLWSIPGRHYNPDRLVEDGTAVLRVSRELAWRKFCLQWLTGDTSDGYPGLPGVGPIKASAIVNSVGPKTDALCSRIIEEYRARGLNFDDCVRQARLARILLAPLWDSKSRQIIQFDPVIHSTLWTQP